MASVLKQDDLARGTDYTKIASFNVEDVQSRARDYLAEVQQQADQILKTAHDQAAQVQATAKQNGLKEAQKQFEAQVEQRAQQLCDDRCKTAVVALETSIDQSLRDTNEWLATWRNQTVEIAAMIAEKLVRREMKDENETLRVWMEEAIVAFRDERDIRIFVHPDDFAIAGRYLQKLSKSLPQANSAEVLPDPEVEQGGCVVRSKNGMIDQQLAVQMQRLVEQLRG